MLRSEWGSEKLRQGEFEATLVVELGLPCGLGSTRLDLEIEHKERHTSLMDIVWFATSLPCVFCQLMVYSLSFVFLSL